MNYCVECGERLVEGAKFCQKCGTSVHKETGKRYQEYEGKIYKCPNCGEVLKSFVRNCPSCGLELRGTRATSAVREFALKLEAIEARREYEKKKRYFSRENDPIDISKTDKQKINLIQNFSVPNTKEDMLEFMILATSNINTKSYDSANSSVTKEEKAITDAWNSKIKQVYEKAKRSYGDAADFDIIQELYDKSNQEIKNARKAGIIKWIVMLGWIPIFFIAVFSILTIKAPGAEKREVIRMEGIYKEAQTALKNDEYKKALLNAEDLVYSPSIKNGNTEELKRQWDIKRELLVDQILKEAEKDGVKLEYTQPKDKEEAKSGFDVAKDNIDKFNEILNGETATKK